MLIHRAARISWFGWVALAVEGNLVSRSSLVKLCAAMIFWVLRKIVCKVLCLCIPLGLPDGPNPRGHQARHVVTTPRRGTSRGAIFVASEASVATRT